MRCGRWVTLAEAAVCPGDGPEELATRLAQRRNRRGAHKPTRPTTGTNKETATMGATQTPERRHAHATNTGELGTDPTAAWNARRKGAAKRPAAKRFPPPLTTIDKYGPATACLNEL